MPEREGRLSQGPDRRALQLFDRVEVILLPVVQTMQRSLNRPETRVTRDLFPWDAAAVGFNWVGTDQIHRNIYVYATVPGKEGEGMPATVPLEGRVSGLVVEVNAWQDDEQMGMRRSHNAVVNRLKPPAFRTAIMYESFKRAYSTVSEWTEVDLTTVSPLTPRPQRSPSA